MTRSGRFSRAKRGVSFPLSPALPFNKLPKGGDVTLPAVRETHRNVAELSARLLSDRYAPPSVIVNEHGDLIYVHGSTGLYLQPAPGQPTHNILTMAREGLRYELTSALRKAVSHDGEVTHRGIQVKTNGGVVRVDLAVVKIADPEALRGLLLVAFKAASEITPAPPSEEPRRGTAGKQTKRDSALARELQYTKESLQSTVEELETSNEELKSTNEELQSTNEEMQSTNEELETSKEEMQSLNEELLTVNSELEGKVEELSQANDDMANLLNATNIATIFLDNDLLIKRFTLQATEVIRLIQSDVGRPISDIVPPDQLHWAGAGRQARAQDAFVQGDEGAGGGGGLVPLADSALSNRGEQDRRTGHYVRGHYHAGEGRGRAGDSQRAPAPRNQGASGGGFPRLRRMAAVGTGFQRRGDRCKPWTGESSAGIAGRNACMGGPKPRRSG